MCAWCAIGTPGPAASGEFCGQTLVLSDPGGDSRVPGPGRPQATLLWAGDRRQRAEPAGRTPLPVEVHARRPLRRARTGPAVPPVPHVPSHPAPPALAAAAGPAAMSGDGPERPDGRSARTGRGGGSRGTGGARPGSGDLARLPGPLLRYRAERRPQSVPELPYPSTGDTGTAGCSYAELDRRARAVAARLGALLQPGSRVMLVYPQGPDLAGAFFGCLYAGMAAVPVVLSGPGATASVASAAQRCAPDLVLTGGDTWTPLDVDRARTQVVEADGIRVSGEPVWRLAQTWRPVGVIRSAPAYHRYHDDGAAGGRLEAAMGHGDLSDVIGELAQAVRLGTDEENVGWIAAVHGVEDAVWRILLPVRISG